ncbi:MAG: FAD-dependent oxidoreductase [Hyphomicrobium sp.]|jgi:pyruvate/2-oxoglutarate dehydrogenase complex dihydrolipoamide dehydrogenase (E3) component|nr:FAD-dependent oxidoreductase [Hyphomicrobium sp.]
MSEDITADICILGAGSAGLSVAAGAVQMGARTVLIEGHRMGGDCLNTGCVPSKSILSAAKVAQTVRRAGIYGIDVQNHKADFAAVQRYVRSIIDAIAPHDSVERFTKLGCRVITARASFTGPKSVVAGNVSVRARRFVIATGSRPFVPSIPGIEEVDFFTNETIFDNSVLPPYLVVIGAGPIGCEMAQAHRRLGSRVTLLDSDRMLPKDDPEAVDVVRRAFRAEGIELTERVRIARIERAGEGIVIVLNANGNERRIEGSHLLIATGRRANVEGLGLDEAGVSYTPHGIKVDARLRTTNKHIYAAGDVIGGAQFTHVANFHAGVILRNALFRLPAKNAPKALPWVTYTDPELAHVGLTEAEARRRLGDAVRILRADFAQNDRAQTDGHTFGFIKVAVSKRGYILGATIVGSQAGELIVPWVLALSSKLKIGDMASIIAPYPTLSEISKRTAGSYFTPTLFSNMTRRVVRFLGVFG